MLIIYYYTRSCTQRDVEGDDTNKSFGKEVMRNTTDHMTILYEKWIAT